MIIGFLGKGGSGKSTLSAHTIRELIAQGNNVLAIDADHNMDLSYELAAREVPPPYLGDALEDLLLHIGHRGHYRDLFRAPGTTPVLSTNDPWSRSYTHTLSPSLRLMLTGPQNNAVVSGASCSHSLATVLKVFLPLLRLAPGEAVVVDEKASVDAVTTGIPTGFDLAVIVVEPRAQSIRVGEQIRDALSHYGVPHAVVGNKCTQHSDDETSLQRSFGDLYAGTVPLGGAPTPALVSELTQRADKNPLGRLARSRAKFEAQAS